MGKGKRKFRPVNLNTAREHDPELYSIMGQVRLLQYELDIKPFIKRFHWTKLPR
jgi:hypothetical protein